ncbi:MAG TPA: Hsp70 family protein, partial [Xanthobacteraceae bacterium]
ALTLVGDFGGGTSDFSVIRFVREDGRLRSHALGNAGIAIAGDTFDYRIIDNVVSPRLGKGGNYKSFDKILTMPNGYFSNFARWNQLAMMKASGELKELKELARVAIDPAPLEKFIELVDNDLGFALYKAVSAVKVALSAQERAEFNFAEAGVDIRESISRAEFESWIAPDIARVAATVDEALASAGIGPAEIDKVFLTGGSSFIPAVKRIFSDRFEPARIETGHQFESIARGLALIGQSEQLGDWAVASA